MDRLLSTLCRNTNCVQTDKEDRQIFFSENFLVHFYLSSAEEENKKKRSCPLLEAKKLAVVGRDEES